jgi:hypothetical protein
MVILLEEIAIPLLRIQTTPITTLRNTEEAIIITTALIITQEIIPVLLTAVAAITQAHSPEVAAVAVILAVPLVAVVEEGNS